MLNLSLVTCRRLISSTTGTVCLILCILAIPMSFQGGLYILDLLDNWSLSYPLLIIAFLEVVAVAWVYGIKRYVKANIINRSRTVGGQLPSDYTIYGSKYTIDYQIWYNHSVSIRLLSRTFYDIINHRGSWFKIIWIYLCFIKSIIILKQRLKILYNQKYLTYHWYR